jgi:Lrp/AsnC family transcriptional regulator, leucine-responsive regulatory protein
MIELDDLDRRILRVLQEDNKLSFAQLAERARSSAASCLRRVRRLREQGAIQADVCLLDRRVAGPSLEIVVTVELERERLDLVDQFKHDMRAADEVTQCYMVTGEADFVLLVNVRDIAAFDAFVRTKLYANPNVRKFNSMIAIDRVKFDTRVSV